VGGVEVKADHRESGRENGSGKEASARHSREIVSRGWGGCRSSGLGLGDEFKVMQTFKSLLRTTAGVALVAFLLSGCGLAHQSVSKTGRVLEHGERKVEKHL
jgi:hypothetical protein